MTRSPDAPTDYWAVVFTSTRTSVGDEDYAATAARMESLASEQPGFLGVESARGQTGVGITVSYWRTEADLVAWKAVSEHQRAQHNGRNTWYESYTTRIAHVTREYTFAAEPDGDREPGPAGAE